MAALSGDAARQSTETRAAFANGIQNTLAALEAKHRETASEAPEKMRAKMINLFATAVGAVMLSRACPDDSALADEILEACHAQLMASLQAD